MSGPDRLRLMLEAGRYREALAGAHRHLATSPQDPDLWEVVARAHLGLEEWQAALQALGTLVAATPNSPTPHLFAALALAGLGRNEEAVAASCEAVRLAPDLWTAHVFVAQYASAVGGQGALAWDAANRAVQLAPNETDTHAAMGLVALRAKRRDVAEQALLRALALDPGNHAAEHNLGLLRLRDGQISVAAEHLGASALADPGASETGRAFHVLILRWLQRTHWVMWGTWLGASLLSGQFVSGSYNVGVLCAVLAGLAALVWWTRRSVLAVGGHLRRVLWTVLRGSWTAMGWFVCVCLAWGFLVLAAVIPDQDLRGPCLSFAAWSLLVGCLVSWVEAGRFARS